MTVFKAADSGRFIEERFENPIHFGVLDAKISPAHRIRMVRRVCLIWKLSETFVSYFPVGTPAFARRNIIAKAAATKPASSG